jgi:hypothetical protein
VYDARRHHSSAEWRGGVRVVRVADRTAAAEETGASVVPCHPDRVRRNYESAKPLGRKLFVAGDMLHVWDGGSYRRVIKDEVEWLQQHEADKREYDKMTK